MHSATPPRITFRDKQFMSLRISYMGGYTGYFSIQMFRMLGMGIPVDEIISRSVDDTMREWVMSTWNQRFHGGAGGA